jgi:hypothetical protein
MTNYIEPTLKTRQLFFFAVVVLGGLAVLTSRLDELLPPLSGDPLLALDQMHFRLLVATVLSTIIFTALSIVAIYNTRRAVQSGQWPAKGMTVPFRTKIVEIKNARNAWLLLAIILCCFVSMVSLKWFIYSKYQELREVVQQSTMRNEECKSNLVVSPSPSFKQGALKRAP